MSNITPAQAEAIASKAISDYIAACHLQTEDRDHIGNVLMKLVGMAGLAMACAEGRAVASDRLVAVAEYIAANGAEHPLAIKKAR